MEKEKIYVVQPGSSILTNQGIFHEGREVSEKNFEGLDPEKRKKFFDDAIIRGSLKLKEDKEIKKDEKRIPVMNKKK